jgi:hypothetical protein
LVCAIQKRIQIPLSFLQQENSINTLEVTPIPEAALVMREDYADTLTRLTKYRHEMETAA